MPPARPRGPAPLTDDDVDRLRGQVAGGAEPRVQLLVDTPSAPAGTRGPVVALRDPAAEPEFIVLRVGGDEVPFGPGELTWPTRGTRERADREPPGAAGDGDGGAAAEPLPVTGAALAVAAPAAAPAGVPAAPPAADLAAGPGPALEEGGDAGGEPVAPPRPRRPRGQAAAPAAQPLTITLRFTGADWTAETTRGGRRGRARPVPVAAVRGFAERLDDVELRRAVLAAVEACREQARARAERLRAELEQVETVLAQLEDD